MKYGSLFSGIGGFDLGFERAGMTAAWQCEIDKQAQEVLRRHFSVEVFNDVRTIGKDAGAVDLVCGGFPCQDVSVAGKRAGLAGERSGLWFEFARVIDELEPGWVVIENVPGLLSSNGGKDFAVIVRWLAERGYGVAWRVLDAQYFGVPQRRRRVFIVASFGSGRAAQVLFESEGLPGDIETGRKAGEGFIPEIVGSLDTGGASGKNAHGGAWPGTTVQSISAGHAFPVAKTLSTKNQRINYETETFVTNFLPQRVRIHDVNGVSPTLQSEQGRGQGVPTIAFGHSGGETLKINEIANTINGQTGSETTAMIQGVMQSTGVRRLTPTECERLQGFPDGWTAGQADTVRYRQLGNAVAVPVAEWIGKRIMEAS